MIGGVIVARPGGPSSLPPAAIPACRRRRPGPPFWLEHRWRAGPSGFGPLRIEVPTRSGYATALTRHRAPVLAAPDLDDAERLRGRVVEAVGGGDADTVIGTWSSIRIGPAAGGRDFFATGSHDAPRLA